MSKNITISVGCGITLQYVLTKNGMRTYGNVEPHLFTDFEEAEEACEEYAAEVPELTWEVEVHHGTIVIVANDEEGEFFGIVR